MRRPVPAAIVLAVLGSLVSLHAAPDHGVSGEYNRSLGVECAHCHASSDFTDSSKPAFDFARRMEQMTLALNDGPLRGRGGVSCWTCHRGRTIPARLPREDWESIAKSRAAAFAGRPEGVALTMSVYAASLGVECSYCHVADDWTNASKAPHRTVSVMNAIFELIPRYFDRAVRMPRTQCFMCHQGHVAVEHVVPPGR